MVEQWVLQLGMGWSLLLAVGLGVGLGALSLAAWAARLHAGAQRELKKLGRSLAQTQAQRDQARRNAEALQEEVQGWRRRQRLGADRHREPMPAPAPELVAGWILGETRPGEDPPQRFVDTQVMTAH